MSMVGGEMAEILNPRKFAFEMTRAILVNLPFSRSSATYALTIW